MCLSDQCSLRHDRATDARTCTGTRASGGRTLGALRVDRLEDVGDREARDDIREAFLELARIFTDRRVRAWYYPLYELLRGCAVGAIPAM